MTAAVDEEIAAGNDDKVRLMMAMGMRIITSIQTWSTDPPRNTVFGWA